MKREVVQRALMMQLERLSIEDLEKEVGMDLKGKEDHIRGMMIVYHSQDLAEDMSEEQMNEFLLNLK